MCICAVSAHLNNYAIGKASNAAIRTSITKQLAIALRQLNRKLGSLSKELENEISSLSSDKLDALTDDLLVCLKIERSSSRSALKDFQRQREATLLEHTMPFRGQPKRTFKTVQDWEKCDFFRPQLYDTSRF